MLFDNPFLHDKCDEVIWVLLKLCVCVSPLTWRSLYSWGMLNTKEELLFECQLSQSLLMFMLLLVNALVVDLANMAIWFAM